MVAEATEIPADLVFLGSVVKLRDVDTDEECVESEAQESFRILKNHLEKMDILRDSIGWRSYGQFDPLLEYKNESFNLFVDTTREIKYNAIYNILKSRFL